MERLVRLHDKSFRLYKSESEILSAIRDIANKINDEYIGKRPLLIPVLNGAFMFASDLMKELKLDCEVSFIRAVSYHGTQSSGDVSIVMGLTQSIEGRHIIIIEDIVDTGSTLAKILPEFKAQNPASVKVATLLLKPFAVKTNINIQVDYVGMEIPNDFIVGYGLDYDGLGRNLRDIYQVMQEE
jgi:hypoxanthine phosphoribosyltransferase